MAKGDIVLIKFPFTDLTGNKLRPAIVIAETYFDLTLCFITSQIHTQTITDMVIHPSPGNGIKKISLIRTNKIATLDRTLVKGLLGRLNQDEISSLNTNLKILFQL